MRNILIMAVLALCSALPLCAQYKPTYTEGKMWKCQGLEVKTYFFTVTVGEEVMIEGRKCRWVYKTIDENSVFPPEYGEPPKDCSYLVCEEDGKIYRVFKNGGGYYSFVLDKDFTLRGGDTFRIYIFGYGYDEDDDNLCSVKREDTITVKGRQYRRLSLGLNDFEEGLMGYNYWVEGIGDNSGFSLFSYLIPNCGGFQDYYNSYVFVACYENGECIFEYDDFYAQATTGVAEVSAGTPKETPVYTLGGQRVLHPRKGEVYVRNGRKFVAH